ncbi:Neu5Ac permease [Klebsiella variicola]|nr:Neu5Ac permease [Klebsiella variicola]
MMILNRIKLAVDRTIAAFSVVVMIALVFCVVWQVFSRYVLNQPSTLTDELARFLMIWVGLLGAAYTVGAQRHLAIDLLTLMLSSRKQATAQRHYQSAYLSVCWLSDCYRRRKTD